MITCSGKWSYADASDASRERGEREEELKREKFGRGSRKGKGGEQV